ncbi:MAG: TRAFs-binding domain-containing protein [Methylococcaceae bacterium]|nr:TRAFs-binding domain-containing protein [Methylococcaceae bacterium]
MTEQPTSNALPSLKIGPKGGERQRTCFVVIGFGRKTDFSTGRMLDLDKTYEQLIRPAFDRLDINCFRAIDANLTGSIDAIMYHWLYQADFVIADLSTLNANVFYELGVRHAQKPNTTLIMAEQVLLQKIPFDLNSFVIHPYVHAGEAIPQEEQDRFVAHLADILRGIIELEKARQAKGCGEQRQGDSPVYQFLPGMAPPRFERNIQLDPPPYVPPTQRNSERPMGESLASLIDAAERAKNGKNYPEAIRLFRKTIGENPKPDNFLAQRLALVTYKNGEIRDASDHLDIQTAIQALLEAEDILARYCAPKISTDPETLGLSGAINKRLFDHTGEPGYLDKAIHFYERGFYVKQDHYNGINAAFLYTIRANLLQDPIDAMVSYGHANLLRRKVVEIGEALIADEAAFQAQGEGEWVYATLAEAYFGLERVDKTEAMERKIDQVASPFAQESYRQQKQKLKSAMERFKARGLEEPYRSRIPSLPAESGPLAAPTPASHPSEQKPITLYVDIEEGRSIQSVEVNCRIEYGPAE